MMHHVESSNSIDLRVSVAIYNRVIFPHPENGAVMLALERKATVANDGSGTVQVQAQPFGGAIRILNSSSLQQLLGEIQFDSERSQREQDFRILIPPSRWGPVKQYCLQHLGNADDPELEALPQRELAEELEETLGVRLRTDQYTVQPAGFVVEDHPMPTENADAFGQLTVRLYRIFKIHILDVALCTRMLQTSQKYSDADLARLALQDLENGRRGWANCILTLPLDTIKSAYLALSPELRYRRIAVDNHTLDESVLAVLGNVDVPQYQRM